MIYALDLYAKTYLNGNNNASEETGALEKRLMTSNKSNTKINVSGSETGPKIDSLTIALRQMHDIVANEPIPEDFLDLLDKIDAKMSATKKFQ